MEACIGSDIESFLQEYGWAFLRVNEQIWKTGFQGEATKFPLLISVSETWLSFLIDPFVSLEIDRDTWPELAVHLLRLSARHPMIKFGIGPQGGIELSLDVLNRQLTYDDFCIHVGLLGFYADLFYEEVLACLDAIGFRYSNDLRLLT